MDEGGQRNTVIPCERSESRDLHGLFNGHLNRLTRRPQRTAEDTENSSPGRDARTGAPFPSIHDQKVFNGPAERSIRRYGAIRPFQGSSGSDPLKSATRRERFSRCLTRLLLMIRRSDRSTGTEPSGSVRAIRLKSALPLFMPERARPQREPSSAPSAVPPRPPRQSVSVAEQRGTASGGRCFRGRSLLTHSLPHPANFPP